MKLLNSLVAVALLFACAWTIVSADDPAGVVPHFRKPVAITLIGEHRLAVANERSGSISLMELGKNPKVLSETSIGTSLSDVVVVPKQSLLLTTDQTTHELLAVDCTGDTLSIVARLKVSPYPVTVRISSDGNRAFVASLWSRTVTIVDVSALLNSTKSAGQDATSSIIKTISLPFAPREQLFVESDGKLIVADAFGPKLAVIDPTAGAVESVRELPAHGIRQLRLHPTKPRLLMTHQMLNRLAHTTFDDVHWGGLMVNCLRSLPLPALLDPKSDPIREARLDYVGGPEQGAGDPAGFVIRTDETVAIALAGTNEVVFDDGNHLYSKRGKAGDRPTAMVLTPDGSSAFVVNTLSDSITMLDLDRRIVTRTVSLGPIPELGPADRGERLFHSAALSHDRWFSCASCHVDGHTSGLLNDNQTDGSFETAKRILSLRGVGDTAPYAWNGRFATLSEQIRHSVRSTMQGDEPTDGQTTDLEFYLRTLPAPPPIGNVDQAAAEHGAKLFAQFDCNRCHSPPILTSSRIVDVNLPDERGRSKFNPPSLRGVGQNGPYFHDGRAATLMEVITKFQHQLDAPLNDEQLRDLLAYLNSL